MSDEVKNVIVQIIKEAPYIGGFLLLAGVQWSYNQDLLIRLTELTSAIIACSAK